MQLTFAGLMFGNHPPVRSNFRMTSFTYALLVLHQYLILYKVTTRYHVCYSAPPLLHHLIISNRSLSNPQPIVLIHRFCCTESFVSIRHRAYSVITTDRYVRDNESPDSISRPPARLQSRQCHRIFDHSSSASSICPSVVRWRGRGSQRRKPSGSRFESFGRKGTPGSSTPHGRSRVRWGTNESEREWPQHQGQRFQSRRWEPGRWG